MARIFVTREICRDILEKLKSGNEVVVSSVDRVLAPQEIIQHAKGADAILTLLTDRWTGEMMDMVGSNLKTLAGKKPDDMVNPEVWKV